MSVCRLCAIGPFLKGQRPWVGPFLIFGSSEAAPIGVRLVSDVGWDEGVCLSVACVSVAAPGPSVLPHREHRRNSRLL